MRADLKSLKDRLGDEVGELGIDSKKAEGLLAAHYKEKDKEDLDSDAAPPKVSCLVYALCYILTVHYCTNLCLSAFAENSSCCSGGNADCYIENDETKTREQF